LDEGIGEGERLQPAIADRLAFHVDLWAIPFGATVEEALRGIHFKESASESMAPAAMDPKFVAGLISAAAALGIHSMRPTLLACRAARAAAALRADTSVNEDDVKLAARLVLAPRARQLPAPEECESGEMETDEGRDSSPDNGEDRPGQDHSSSSPRLEDVIVEAAVAALPKGLLARLAQRAGQEFRASGNCGSSGPERSSRKRGRPIGSGRGVLGGGARLNVVETLRAAAPWQRLRGGFAVATESPAIRRSRLKIRPEDFRFKRYAERSEAVTIFVVDASGSTALHRLGEAKGAVEQLLADCYIRRDHVALIVMRGHDARLVLPPTRALARAKRSLAGLPGGGGTPLAAGIEQSVVLATAARRRAQQPTIVLLTDGAANVARDGRKGRKAGEDDAIAAARQAAVFGFPVLLIDTGPRPSALAARLAETIRARYFAMPMANAESLSRIVKNATCNG
jgi:magnesium chelatase subunit D